MLCHYDAVEVCKIKMDKQMIRNMTLPWDRMHHAVKIPYQQFSSNSLETFLSLLCGHRKQELNNKQKYVIEYQ